MKTYINKAEIRFIHDKMITTSEIINNFIWNIYTFPIGLKIKE